MRTAERGFSLLEVVVCVALFALASAATAGVVAAIARNATPGATRDAALMVAENVLVRARSAVAYASPPAADGTAPVDDRSWGLVAGQRAFVAGARIVAPAACGGSTPLLLRLPVTTTFDVQSQRFTVTVRYPRDACVLDAAADDATVSLTQTLPPSAAAPGATSVRDIPTPARM